MPDNLPQPTALAVREMPSQRTLYLERMEASRLRMRMAMQRVKDRAHELTPAARIQAHPQAWIFGGLLLGFAYGLLTGGRRRY